MKYKFSGRTPRYIPQVGIVQPGQVVSVQQELNHPHIKKHQKKAKDVENKTKLKSTKLENKEK